MFGHAHLRKFRRPLISAASDLRRLAPGRTGSPLVLASAVLLLLAVAGCASFKTKQTDESFNPATGETRKITTEAEARTFAAGKSVLANWKASQTDKTQGASVGSLSQEANGADLVAAAVAAAVKAAVKP